jgi:uncharacterized protein (DUF952 family)
MKLVYKILTKTQWSDFSKSGTFNGSVDDLRDGFIHLSSIEQLNKTVQRHFSSENTVYIASFSAESFSSHLKWETASSGDLFPHLYGLGLKFSEMVECDQRMLQK